MYLITCKYNNNYFRYKNPYYDINHIQFLTFQKGLSANRLNQSDKNYQIIAPEIRRTPSSVSYRQHIQTNRNQHMLLIPFHFLLHTNQHKVL